MAVTNLLPDNLFPARIHGLLRTISRAGFFDGSVMIGSWVMLIYQELYGARYALRTLDVDFAVHIAHTQSQLRADLKQIITGLGFMDYLAARNDKGNREATAAPFPLPIFLGRPSRPPQFYPIWLSLSLPSPGSG